MRRVVPNKSWKQSKIEVVRLPTSNLTNYQNRTNYTSGTLLEKKDEHIRNFLLWIPKNFPHPANVLDMKLNNPMARFQPLRFGECWVSIHCHCAKVHSDPDWYHLIGSFLWIKWKKKQTMNANKWLMLNCDFYIAQFNCVQKKTAQIHFRILSTKCVYKSYIYIYIYIKRAWH